ncbi:MAG: D-aminoacyl-tRNA deacylase [Archaeoglobus sp.]|nr:D-aminoacyl-tRNA deacylase [Archaeoglobus sp.]
MHLVIVSKEDIAGMNIKDWLLTMGDFEEKRLNDFTLYFGGNFHLAEVKKRLIYVDGIDLELKKYVDFDKIIFASRHSSKDERKIFSVHVSGNIGTADYGGKPYSLAKPDPFTMKNYVLALKEKLHRKPEFQFTMEVTHHGPSEISTPSAFYEIGSTEEEWRDEEAAKIVAESIFEAIGDKRNDWHVAVGVGGTHYAPRQTEIILSTTFTFGHNFAKYTFPHLTEDFIRKALEITETNTIIIDEKSTTSSIKKMLQAISESFGTEILKSKQVKREFCIY